MYNIYKKKEITKEWKIKIFTRAVDIWYNNIVKISKSASF
jgi:hypothetical protein